MEDIFINMTEELNLFEERMKKAVKDKLFMEDLKEVAKDFESIDLEEW